MEQGFAAFVKDCEGRGWGMVSEVALLTSVDNRGMVGGGWWGERRVRGEG